MPNWKTKSNRSLNYEDNNIKYSFNLLFSYAKISLCIAQVCIFLRKVTKISRSAQWSGPQTNFALNHAHTWSTWWSQEFWWNIPNNGIYIYTIKCDFQLHNMWDMSYMTNKAIMWMQGPRCAWKKLKYCTTYICI
jgi:hypothetical protein